MFKYVLPVVLPLVLGPAALAQHHPSGGHHSGGHHSGGHLPSPQSPYAGFEKRSIKAFSDQQLEDLKQGRGIGLALPAELNGYPGPIHILELADQLALSADQKRRTQELYAAMTAETVELGMRLIEQEKTLDQLFSQRRITVDGLSQATAEIGATQAKLRNAHLKYHLSTVDVLKPEQVKMYNMLRGYAYAR